VIVSDDSSYYIGKTNNYLFYYKEKTKETVVYPMSRVKMISFKNRGKKQQPTKKSLQKPKKK